MRVEADSVCDSAATTSIASLKRAERKLWPIVLMSW